MALAVLVAVYITSGKRMMLAVHALLIAIFISSCSCSCTRLPYCTVRLNVIFRAA